MKASFRKIISSIITVALFVVLIGVNLTVSFADTELVIEVGDASFDTQSSSYVNVPVSITQNSSGFVDMQFSIKFDPSVFSSVNNVVIPNDSMLYYAADASIEEVTQKPTVAAGADNKNGLVRIAMSGVFQKNTQGESEQYVFSDTGIMFNLRMKLREDVESISDAASKISIMVSDSAETPFIFRSANSEEIPLESVSSKAGTMSIKTTYTVSSLTINTFDVVIQKASEVTPVTFTAETVCNGIYPQSDIKWYVNGELASNGEEFVFTPPAEDGEYKVHASIQEIISNEIIVSVGSLYLPEAPEETVEGKQFIGYTVKMNGYDMLLPAGAEFLGTANELKNAQPIWFSLEMTDGASVKLSVPAGLRFTAKANAEEYDMLFKAAGRFNFYLGMIIAPLDVVNSLDEFTIDELQNYGYPTSGMLSNEISEKDSDGYYVYNGTIWNILENNYNRKFAARAYAQITYSDGTNLIIYSDYDNRDNARSVSSVAYAALTDVSAEYTAEQLTVLRMFVDGDVNINADGTPFYFAEGIYAPPYEISVSEDGKIITVTAKNTSIWLANKVCAVTFNGERLLPSQYILKGSKIVIVLK